jgi:hypothetical protein
MEGAKETEENHGLAHRIVSGAPGSVQAELSTFGNLESRSAIIHRTVWWVTGLSGVPAEQRLRSTTVDSNGRLQCEQCADSSRRVSVTPGFKEQSRVHLIHAPKKTTYIITECIEINVIKHHSIYYIAEDLLQNKIMNIKRTKDRRRLCQLRNAT